jgi:hypothetical protein
MMQIRLTGGDAMLALWLALLAGCAPLHLWDTHTTSTPRPQSFNVGELTHEPVATFGLLAPGGLQGFNPTLSHALIAALAEASPPIQGIPTRETMNTLNDQRLTAEYADLISGFTRSGVLERERLQRIGSALFLPLRALARAYRIQSSHNRSAGALRLEVYTEPGHHPAAVAATLEHANRPDSLGVGRRDHDGDRALKTRTDHSPQRDRADALAAHDSR